MNLRELANKHGVPYGTVKCRKVRYPNNPEKWFAKCNRKVIYLTRKGNRKSLVEWAKKYGVDRTTFYEAYTRLGSGKVFDWFDKSREERNAVRIDRQRRSWRKRNRVIPFRGRQYTLDGLARKFGVESQTMRKWITKYGLKEATHTKRGWNPVEVEVSGKKYLLRDAEIVTGICKERLRDRKRKGISGERFVSKDNLKGRYIDLDGERKMVAEWAEENGLPKGTVYSRLHRGVGARNAVNKPKSSHWRKSEMDTLRRELLTFGIVY